MIVTNLGNMTFEIQCGKAPNLAEKFLELSKSKYYNSLKFKLNDKSIRSIPTEDKEQDTYYDSSFRDITTDKSLTHS